MEAVTLQPAGMTADLSIWGLAMQADFVVKLVMLALLLASFWCWAIIFQKIKQIRKLKAQASEFEDSFWSGGSLEELYERIGTTPDHPLAMLFAVAMREWTLATTRGIPISDGQTQFGLQGRIDRVMTVALQREMEALEQRLGFLATVGSTAPFIGLFGTVWGIMNSFQSIAMTKNTSLAVVAPGIAEALLATALGLVAAIPAVVAYNKLSGDLNRYAGRLETFAGEFSALLSRQMAEREL
jgi:biopolymer transport protein TolQ